jgi:hypothetical protein
MTNKTYTVAFKVAAKALKANPAFEKAGIKKGQTIYLPAEPKEGEAITDFSTQLVPVVKTDGDGTGKEGEGKVKEGEGVGEPSANENSDGEGKANDDEGVINPDMLTDEEKANAVDAEWVAEKLDPYLTAYPNEKEFHITTDGQVFLNEVFAQEHQRSLKNGKEVYLFIVEKK